MTKKKKLDKDNINLLKIIAITVIAFAVFIALVVLIGNREQPPQTVDDLHIANIMGKLDPEQGYMYKGFSFINFSGLWYSRLAKGNTKYDVTFNYDPLSVEEIPVIGTLGAGFKDSDVIYVTFDPESPELKYAGIANYGLSRSLSWAFGYTMIAGCTKNVTEACSKAGIFNCGDENKSVIFLKDTGSTGIILNDSCVTIQGEGEELVRAKDRLLMRWYGIMD